MSLAIPSIPNVKCSKRDSVVRQHECGARLVRARAALSCGVFEACVAQPGPYHTRFNMFALVMSDAASASPVACNGAVVSPAGDHEKSFSVLSPGDVIWGSFAAPAHYDILYLDPAWLRAVLAVEFGGSCASLASHIRFAPSTTLLALWRRIRMCLSNHAADRDKVFDPFVRLLVVHLAELGSDQTTALDTRTDATRVNNKSVADAIRFIDANLSGKLTLHTIASRACLSPFHFCRVFRAQTGLSVRQFILERRLLSARRLLSTSDERICVIAHLCGFSSQSHLTSAFKARFETTPSAFRRNVSRRVS